MVMQVKSDTSSSMPVPAIDHLNVSSSHHGADHANHIPQNLAHKSGKPCQEQQNCVVDQNMHLQQDGTPEHALICAQAVSNSNAAHQNTHRSLLTDQQEQQPQQLQLSDFATAASHQHMQLSDPPDAAFQVKMLEQLVGKALACAACPQHSLPANLHQRLIVQESQGAEPLGPCSYQQHAPFQSEHLARCAVMMQSTQQVTFMVCTEARTQQQDQSFNNAVPTQHQRLVESPLLQLQELPVRSIFQLLSHSAGAAHGVCMPAAQNVLDAAVDAEQLNMSGWKADTSVQPAGISSNVSACLPDYAAVFIPRAPDIASEQSEVLDIKTPDGSQPTSPVRPVSCLAAELNDEGCVAVAQACATISGKLNALTLRDASHGTK